MEVYSQQDIYKYYPSFDETAKCSGMDINKFYCVEEYPNRNKADKRRLQNTIDDLRKVCDGCPFLEQCRDYAIKYEFYGFWGGLTPGERDAIRKKSGIITKKRIANIPGDK